MIQQRTLRDLRAAVRPRQPRTKPSPLTYLPEQFKKPTIAITGPEDSEKVSVGEVIDKDRNTQAQPVVIEVVETVSEVAPESPAPPLNRGSVSSKKLAMLESIQKQAAGKSWAVENPDPTSKNHVPISRAERRRLIKAEIQKLSQSEERVYYQRRLW